jgi:hypothetical protein
MLKEMLETTAAVWGRKFMDILNKEPLLLARRDPKASVHVFALNLICLTVGI